MLDGNSGVYPTEVRYGGELTCRNNAMVTCGRSPHTVVLGGLTYQNFAKYVLASVDDDAVSLRLYAEDPFGHRVNGGESYRPKRDAFYLDIATANPFDALELYGRVENSG